MVDVNLKASIDSEADRSRQPDSAEVPAQMTPPAEPAFKNQSREDANLYPSTDETVEPTREPDSGAVPAGMTPLADVQS